MSQLVRLTLCIAIVLNKDEVDEEVLSRVNKVCVDTSRGRVLEICRHLYKAGPEGITIEQLYMLTSQKLEEERTLVYFLRKIEAVEFIQQKNKHGVTTKARWKLSHNMRKLYAEVMQPSEES